MYKHDFAERSCLVGATEAPGTGGRPRKFPAWHFAMLNDERRNCAIEMAIAELELAGKTVFEIGAGTGLVALLFAKHGAKQVFTCEMNSVLGRIAEEVIQASPYADRITVLHVSSRRAIEAGLLPCVPDVIFTETVDCGIIGEGYFDIREDIRRLAGPDTLILPSRIEQHGALVESPAIRGLNEVKTVCGFDLSILNRFSSRAYYPVRAPLYPFHLLTDWVTVRTYDYRRDHAQDCVVSAERSGLAHGLLTWFSLHFGRHSVSNCIGLDSHWHQAFHPLPEPRPVAAGEFLRLHLDNTGAIAVHGPEALRALA